MIESSSNGAHLIPLLDEVSDLSRMATVVSVTVTQLPIGTLAARIHFSALWKWGYACVSAHRNEQTGFGAVYV